jgi:serine/threonine protein kinase
MKIPTIEDLELTDSYHDIFSQYKFHKKLGKGGFGRVFEATRIKDGYQVAIKVSSKADCSAGRLKTMRREVDVHKNLDHPSIIKYYDFLESQKNIYIVMEIARGGDIRSLIELRKQAREFLPEEEIKIIALRVLEGLKYLHDKDYCHR